MRKFIFVLCCCLAVLACKPKKSDIKPIVKDLVVENLISMDRQDMFTNYSEDYVWYETTIKLDNFMDSDSTLTVVNVTTVFQYLKDGQPKVVTFDHNPIGNWTYAVDGFWVEDEPLDSIAVTFTDALQKIMETNYPKPHSRYCVLRKEVGALAANPQYIFGNQSAQLYVDAITGEVRDWNPAYPKDAKLSYAFSW